eukprot:42396-Eustigmatos_ZCMA.PRE.1
MPQPPMLERLRLLLSMRNVVLESRTCLSLAALSDARGRMTVSVFDALKHEAHKGGQEVHHQMCSDTAAFDGL